jgi:N-methylhydantoinase A
MGWRLGIDIGGTFTDIALVQQDTGRFHLAKLLTTRQDFGAAVIDGVRAASPCWRTQRPW